MPISEQRISPVLSSGPSCVQIPTCFIDNGPENSLLHQMRFFVDGGRQFPLAEHAGIAEDLPGLGLRRSRESTQDEQGQEMLLTTFARNDGR